MVKYMFLVKLEDATVTSVLEYGNDFGECFHQLDCRLRIRCGFENYELLSAQLQIG